MCVVGYSFILGGARSGKSRYAEERASLLAEQTSWPVVYLATGTVTDSEMQIRIAAHQHNRPAHWTTIEEPVDVAQWLDQRQAPAVVLLDCLSLLLNNWMYAGLTDEAIAHRSDALGRALEAFRYGLVVVSNEVGQGIVPEYALARRYRDALGRLNQQVARTAEHVIWMVAGRPVDVRKLGPEW
ncbi:bifunctional adenosylcobinamide kinase/adenosylcobinamide-phosphate guanylyltransferase [Sulfobacillus sp. DSM 109850]|uniref:Adenosylcobinamide kinase n=1 Tax=Sulfobacillus harzensis TaxID=2729629 RepID=A0A7Y0L8L3_9FIRM|nr:bifunctional adenosylcobinamide kinase/adenosylcobinamide-phosphate guanylyltransferase [Sulfobacillus harzensis]NMP23889.1 bifunctional adenosylcobinamide kinase/adenosylcobinamide-phosphate guanylyltransferase [Sulfobacillus harzensis]